MEKQENPRNELMKQIIGNVINNSSKNIELIFSDPKKYFQPSFDKMPDQYDKDVLAIYVYVTLKKLFDNKLRPRTISIVRKNNASHSITALDKLNSYLIYCLELIEQIKPVLSPDTLLDDYNDHKMSKKDMVKSILGVPDLQKKHLQDEEDTRIVINEIAAYKIHIQRGGSFK